MSSDPAEPPKPAPPIPRLPHVAFVGLIRNRPLGEVTQQELRGAFAKAGLREAHNAHFFSRLVNRGVSLGLKNLADVERALNGGTQRPGKYAGTAMVVFPGGRVAAVFNARHELITLVPPNEA